MIINLLEGALNFIFPPVCGICGKTDDKYICSKCFDRLKIYEKVKTDTYEDKYFKTHFWIYEYKDEIRKRIIDYKFNDKSYIFRTFVELIESNSKAVEYINSFDVIVPVPIHKKRLKQRGYNQCELIAKALSKSMVNLTYANKILIKKRNITPQSTLNKAERTSNIQGAYQLLDAQRYDLKSKRILIFDDIYTTGSTVNECAKVLKKLTNEKIGVFTLAKD